MKVNKKIKSIFVACLIILLFLAGGVVVRNIILQQVKNKIQPSLGYSRIHLKIFPPTLVIDDARTASSSPFFSAGRISIQLAFRYLLSKEKPLLVLIESPVMRFYSPAGEKADTDKSPFQIGLPFTLDRAWVRNGELFYWGEEARIQMRGINAAFQQRRDQFSFLAEAGESVYYSTSHQTPLEISRVSLALEGRGEEIQVNKLKVNGPAGVVRAQGRLTGFRDPSFNLNTSFNIKSYLIARLLKLPFDWEGQADGKGVFSREKGQVDLDADFSSNTIHLNGVDMGLVTGKVGFSTEMGGRVDILARRQGLPPDQMRIQFKNRKVEGFAWGVHVDPVMKFLRLPWPVSSGAWGTFTLEKKRLAVEADLRRETQEMSLSTFPVQGKVYVSWDGRRNVTFSSPKLLSAFGELKVEGNVHVGQNIDVHIEGDVTDVKQARDFTSVLLRKDLNFPEIRGKGQADFQIFGDYFSPQLKGDFALSPGGFERFDVQTVNGGVELSAEGFSGSIEFNDPAARGRARISVDGPEVKANIQIDEGTVDRILPLLNLSLPLEGRASGEFELNGVGSNLHFSGAFTSQELVFLNLPFTQVRSRLAWKEGSLTLTDFYGRFQEGDVQGETRLSFSQGEYAIDIRGNSINFGSLSSALEGVLSFDLGGKGRLGKDVSSGKFSIRPLSFRPFQETEAEGEIKLNITKEWMNVILEGNFLPGKNEFLVSLDIPFDEKPFSGEFSGSFANLDLLLPWEGAEGQINYIGELEGPLSSPQFKGAIDFQGTLFPLPRFAYALHDYSGLIFVENSTLTLRSLKAQIGGGDVQGQGTLRLGKGGVDFMDIRLEGKNLLLSPLERTRALAEGELNLIKDAERFVLNGDFYVHRLSWQRELNERFVFYSTPYYQSRREPGFFDDLNLNIRLRADDNAWMENSLGRIRGRMDLMISGNVKLPIVLGDIEAIDGYVFFQDRRFDILRGRVSFSNPMTIEPYLSFTGETYVKDYRVTFGLDGLLDKLTPEFSSSPPLPPEDVLALLTLGESFRRTYQYDRSRQQSTASLVSFQLSEEAKKSADKIFRLDRFRIDPFVLGSSTEMTARLTLGKRISRNFFILYSTNLTTQREEIMRLEWELTKDLSIVSTRDEKGRISIDIKIHKRF
jgi:hypothetical protein